MTKPSISRGDLLSALMPKVIPTTIAGLGQVHIKEFTALQRIQFLSKGEIPTDPEGQLKFMAALLPHSITDAAGKSLLKASDVEALINAKYDVVQSLIGKMLEVNGISKGAADDLEKNSETTPNSDSSTT